MDSCHLAVLCPFHSLGYALLVLCYKMLKCQKNSVKPFNDCVALFVCWNKLNESCSACVVCVYFVVSKTMSSPRKDSTFTTGRTARY